MNNKDKQQDHCYNDLIVDNSYPKTKKPNQNTNADCEQQISQTDIIKIYKGQITDSKCIYKRTLPNGDTKEVFHLNIPNRKALVLKVEEFASQRTRKYNGMYREYYIGKTLGAICSNIAQTFDLQEIEVSEGKRTRVELLTEYGGIDFFKNKTKPGDSLRAAYQLLNALKLMEERGVSHFDIKPENIVWNAETSCLKLIDFGTSLSFYVCPQKVFEEIGDNEEKIIGFTNEFCPPELHALVEGNLPFRSLIPQKVDVFAFGITLYEMLLSEHNIPNKRMVIKNKELLNTYLNKIRLHMKEMKAEPLICILENCASYEPSKRKSFAELFKMYADILSEVHKTETIKICLVSIDYASLANKYENIGDFDTACWFYELALQSKAQQQNISELYFKLGVVYYMLSQYSKALDFLQKAEAQYIKIYGKDHTNIAEIYFNIGKVYCAMQKVQIGLKYLFRSLKTFLKFYNEENYSVINCYYIIGIAYSLIEQPEKAKLYFEKVTKFLETNKMENRESLAQLYAKLANVSQGKENISKMNEYIKLAENCLEGIPYSINCQSDKVYMLIAQLLFESGKFNAAISYAKKAIRIVRKGLGEGCFLLSSIYALIAEAWNFLGNKEVAIENYLNAKDILLQNEKDNIKEIKEYDFRITIAYIQSGHPIVEEEIKKLIIECPSENLGKLYYGLGIAYFDSSLDISLNYFRKAKNYLCKNVDGNVQLIIFLYFFMGRIKNISNKEKKAKKYLNQALRLIENCLKSELLLYRNIYGIGKNSIVCIMISKIQ